MNDRTDLDRLWDDVPVGTLDLSAALRGGTRLRRRRQSLGAVVATAVLVLGIGGGGALWSRPDATPEPLAPGRSTASDTAARSTATVYYLLDEPVPEGGYFEPATLLTPREVAVEDTGSPGYDALHALLTLEPPNAGLTEGFNVLDQTGDDPTIDVASVTHADGVVRVELTGTPYDPYPTVDFCCPSDGEAVTQQLVHTVQAALGTDDPVAFGVRGIWLHELDGPVEADPGVVVPPEQPPPASEIDLDTSDWQPGDAALTSRLAGTLTVTGGGCVVVEEPESPPTHVVWPQGYRAFDVAGRLVLLDAQGRLVARQGDRIEARGGEPAVVGGSSCARRATFQFYVQSDISLQG